MSRSGIVDAGDVIETRDRTNSLPPWHSIDLNCAIYSWCESATKDEEAEARAMLWHCHDAWISVASPADDCRPCGCVLGVRLVCVKHCGGHAIPESQDLRPLTQAEREFVGSVMDRIDDGDDQWVERIDRDPHYNGKAGQVVDEEPDRIRVRWSESGHRRWLAKSAEGKRWKRIVRPSTILAQRMTDEQRTLANALAVGEPAEHGIPKHGTPVACPVCGPDCTCEDCPECVALGYESESGCAT